MIITKFRNYLNRRLQESITDCKKLFMEVKQQGFNGSYFSVYRHLRLLKSKNSKVDNRGFHRFETQPGEQAQVDWGSFRTSETNGKVESGVKFIRNNFMQGMKFNNGFSSLEELNKKALLWIESIANLRIHGTTGERPIEE